MKLAKGTLCTIVAALTFGFSTADAKSDSWNYKAERCGFELTQTKGHGDMKTEKRLSYGMRDKSISLTLEAPGKDKITINAVEEEGENFPIYRVKSVHNHSAIETCDTGKELLRPCPKKVLMGAEKIVRKHVGDVFPYKQRWQAKDSYRCNILGGWW